MNTLPLSIAVCAILGLAGCCTGASTDPRSGGLRGGVCGQSTGAYEQRIKTRESTLASLQELETALDDRISEARQTAIRLDARAEELRLLDVLKAKVEEVSASTAAERLSLARINTRLDGMRVQLAELLAKHKAMSEISPASGAESADEVDELERDSKQLRDIESELDNLFDEYFNLDRD